MHDNLLESITDLNIAIVVQSLQDENIKLKKLLALTIDNLEESLALIEDKFDIETKTLK
jgi:hypothetical protein